jgi:hypothetical protein
MNRNARAEQWNYAIPLSPDVYIIVGVFIQVCHLPVECNRCVTSASAEGPLISTCLEYSGFEDIGFGYPEVLGNTISYEPQVAVIVLY